MCGLTRSHSQPRYTILLIVVRNEISSFLTRTLNGRRKHARPQDLFSRLTR